MDNKTQGNPNQQPQHSQSQQPQGDKKRDQDRTSRQQPGGGDKSNDRSSQQQGRDRRDNRPDQGDSHRSSGSIYRSPEADNDE